MNDLGYLFAALAVIWVGLCIYMFYLSQRLRELKRDVEELERKSGEPR